jgi:hypothetical protein
MEVVKTRLLLWCSSACGRGRARCVLVSPLGGCQSLGFGQLPRLVELAQGCTGPRGLSASLDKTDAGISTSAVGSFPPCDSEVQVL